MDLLDCLVRDDLVDHSDQADMEDPEMPYMHRTVWMRCTIAPTSCNHSTCTDIASHSDSE